MSELEVPQATLARIRSVVDAAAAGEITAEQIAHKTSISRRHVNYAAAAAKAIGLISTLPKGRLAVPSLGRRLAATTRDSEEERRVLRDAIERSAFIGKLAPGLLGPTPPQKNELAKRMERQFGLSSATAQHRAAMLLRWRKLLLAPQMRLFHRARQSMWRRIEIRNFRSIEHAVVNLAPFTIVVGTNGSGKSNFADALVFARDVAVDASAAISNRGGIVGIRRWRRTKPTDVTVDVRASVSESLLAVDYARHYLKIHSGRQGDWNFSSETIEIVEKGTRKAWLERSKTTVSGEPRGPAVPSATASAMVGAKQFKQFARTSALRNVRRYRLNPDAMRQPQLAAEETRLREAGDNIAAAIRSIHDSGHIETIVEPMAKIVPGLQDVYVEQVGRYVALKFRQMQDQDAAEFNATEMSDGALRALGIVVATYQMAADELLIIEEPEVSIHVGAAQLLFEHLKEASNRGAVLVTTHSADLLDAARDEEILVCEYENGATRIGPMSKIQRKVVRDGLFSVAELMRSEPLRIDDSASARSRETRTRADENDR
jgi:predicted ATPase